MSIAAAFVLAAAAITGSALMIRGMGNTPERLATELEQETDDRQAALFENFLSLEFGVCAQPGTVPDEDGNNAYTSSVTAESIHHSDDTIMPPEGEIQDFSVDLDAAQSYLKRTPILLNNPEEIIGGMPADTVLYRGKNGARISDSFTDYCDGEHRYWIVDNFKRPDSTFSEPGVLLEPYQRDRTPYNANDIAAIKDHYYNGGEDYYYFGGCKGYPEYNSRSRRSELIMIDRTPDSYAKAYLTMFELWDIAGEKTFAGRDCVVIDGLIEKEPIEVDWATSFTMYVDKETGFVVSFATYDDAGKLTDFSVYEELFFDDEAEMVVLDPDQYDIFDPSYYETDK